MGQKHLEMVVASWDVKMLRVILCVAHGRNRVRGDFAHLQWCRGGNVGEQSLQRLQFRWRVGVAGMLEARPQVELRNEVIAPEIALLRWMSEAP